MSTTLGQIIRKARKSAGLRQADLAGQIGLTPPALSQIEGDIVVPKRSTLIALSRELGSDFGLEWLRERESFEAEAEMAASKHSLAKEIKFANDVATIVARANPTYKRRDKLTAREAVHLILELLLDYNPDIIEQMKRKEGGEPQSARIKDVSIHRRI